MSCLTQTLGFVGCGTLSSAIITGLCTPTSDSTGVARRVIVSPRNATKAAALKDKFPSVVTVATCNQDVVDQSDIVFLAVRPQVVDEIVSALKFKETHVVISLVATANFKRIAPLCADVPAAQLARACPVPAVAERRGVTTVFGNGLAKEVFDNLGTAVVLTTEAHMDVMMTLGCVMGPFYELEVKTAQWLVEQGVAPATSVEYTASVYNMFAQDAMGKRHLGPAGIAALVEEQTPGGLNETNIKKLTQEGFYQAHVDVMDSTLAKLRGTKKIGD